MSTAAPAKTPRTNRLGLILKDYKGAKSTLCGGCGHDAITNALIRACWELGVDQEQTIKVSGIGCSSKTPTYMMSRSHGVNTLHGRMPSFATGAMLANRGLNCIGVSGDGDSASIGIGQMIHLIRRDLNMLYIIENNGVYGLTKGQFSATADEHAPAKKGDVLNELAPVDLASMAIDLGCCFVARGFSGNTKQLIRIFQAAIAHRGTAIIDVLSPCVTFNDFEGSTKSYEWGKANERELCNLDFVPHFEHPVIESVPGEVIDVPLYDGSVIRFKEVDEAYDPRNRHKAQAEIHRAVNRGVLLTGILYLEPDKPDLAARLGMSEQPLVHMGPELLRPGSDALDAINRELMAQ